MTRSAPDPGFTLDAWGWHQGASILKLAMLFPTTDVIVDQEALLWPQVLLGQGMQVIERAAREGYQSVVAGRARDDR